MELIFLLFPWTKIVLHLFNKNNKLYFFNTLIISLMLSIFPLAYKVFSLFSKKISTSSGDKFSDNTVFNCASVIIEIPPYMPVIISHILQIVHKFYSNIMAKHCF